MNSLDLLRRYGFPYLFTIIVVYVSSSIYSNLGNNYISEILNNNLHYSVGMNSSESEILIVLSVKNTGYRPIKDLKILVYGKQAGLFMMNFDSSLLKMLSQDEGATYLHNLYQMTDGVYPNEIRNVSFRVRVSDEFKNKDMTLDAVKIRVYSSNVPAILSHEISDEVGFEIGPILKDLLWAIGWTYLTIGLFIVLPVASFIFLLLYLAVKAFRIKIDGINH